MGISMLRKIVAMDRQPSVCLVIRMDAFITCRAGSLFHSGDEDQPLGLRLDEMASRGQWFWSRLRETGTLTLAEEKGAPTRAF
jgi:hypothetical protein